MLEFGVGIFHEFLLIKMLVERANARSYCGSRLAAEELDLSTGQLKNWSHDDREFDASIL